MEGTWSSVLDRHSFRQVELQTRLGSWAVCSLITNLAKFATVLVRRHSNEACECAAHYIRASKPARLGDLFETSIRSLKLMANGFHAGLQDILGGRPSYLSREYAL